MYLRSWRRMMFFLKSCKQPPPSRKSSSKVQKLIFRAAFRNRSGTVTHVYAMQRASQSQRVAPSRPTAAAEYASWMLKNVSTASAPPPGNIDRASLKPKFIVQLEIVKSYHTFAVAISAQLPGPVVNLWGWVLTGGDLGRATGDFSFRLITVHKFSKFSLIWR